jgi:thiamine pyrophosphate-dependent acetolactate synthase large subunit-like protein
MGMGMVRPDYPMYVAGARSQALKNADVVLLIGARFNWIFHFGLPPRFARGVKVIQIDITAEEIGRNVPATVGIVGDAKMVLAQLNMAWTDNPVTQGKADWIRSLREYATKTRRRFSRCWMPTRCPWAIIASIARSEISFRRILSSSPMALAPWTSRARLSTRINPGTASTLGFMAALVLECPSLSRRKFASPISR